MEFAQKEMQLVSDVAHAVESTEPQLIELNELQLSLIGGGVGEVVLC